MSDIAIKADNVSKLYRIDSQQGGRNFLKRKTSVKESFWALKGVSFEVKRGQVIGIVGRNGAGKSTLLKILSRITGLTEGRVEIRGHVGSLLEVGTGFHPELTGRENIFLNGAVLGMSQAEVRRKFDEIVAFSEVEKFLDTPVKRYSSGMYTRLAFAVAAHLEPEILIVDEVLAVGDAEFQKKCLGKMEEIGKMGRTVFFVSHNMGAVEKLCNCALMLEDGQVKSYNTDVAAVTREYLFGNETEDKIALWENASKQYVHSSFKPLRFYISDEEGRPASKIRRNDTPIRLNIEGDIEQLDASLNIGYTLYDENGNLLYRTYHRDGDTSEWPQLRVGRNVLQTVIPAHLLNEGDYRIELMVSLHHRQWLVQPGVNAPAIFLTISGGLSHSPIWTSRRDGMLAPLMPWSAL